MAEKQESALRVMGAAHTVRIEWGGRTFVVAPKPFSEMENVLRLMDDTTAGLGGKTFVGMFKANATNVLQAIRFFLDAPADVTDDWMMQNLNVPALKWLWAVVREVNQLEFIDRFFGSVPALLKAAAGQSQAGE